MKTAMTESSRKGLSMEAPGAGIKRKDNGDSRQRDATTEGAEHAENNEILSASSAPSAVKKALAVGAYFAMTRTISSTMLE